MSSPTADPVTRLVSTLEDLRNEAVAARNELSTRYATLPMDDPRRVTARHIKAVVSSVYLSAMHLDTNLVHPTWWETTFQQIPPAVQDELDDFQTFLAINATVVPLGAFEAGLRRVVRAMDGQACQSGNAEFKSIYEWLFKRLESSGWSYPDGDPRAFLDLTRNVRNTIHNNGSYRPSSGRSASVLWKGQAYDFVVNSVPSFGGWAFHRACLGDLIALNYAVMTAPMIAALPAIA